MHSGGPQTKGDKIRIGYPAPAFSGAQKRVEVLRNPSILEVPKEMGTKSEVAASPLPSRGPKRGWKCYKTSTFSGVPNKGTKSKVKTYARANNDAPSISKHGSLVQADTQIVALC